MDYEKNIEKLNEIINRLENEKMSLSQEIELFKEAQCLYKDCNEYLENAKGNIYKIKRDLELYLEEKLNTETND